MTPSENGAKDQLDERYSVIGQVLEGQDLISDRVHDLRAPPPLPPRLPPPSCLWISVVQFASVPRGLSMSGTSTRVLCT